MIQKGIGIYYWHGFQGKEYWNVRQEKENKT